MGDITVYSLSPNNESTDVSFSNKNLSNHGNTTTVNLDADFVLRICYLVIGCFGMTGNLFVISVMMTSKRLKASVTNCFIINQSVLDFWASFFIITTSFIRDIDHVETEVGKELFCRLWLTNLPVWSLFVSSTYNMLMLTYERYVAIVFPMKFHRKVTHSRAYILMVVIWLLGPVYNTAYMVPTSHLHNRQCSVYTKWPTPLAMQVVGVLTVCIQFFIPLFFITFAYVHMAVVLRRSLNDTHGLPPVINSNRTRRLGQAHHNVIKTLLLVCACFILCWICNQVYYLLYNLGCDKIDFNSTFYHFTVIAVFCNSCLNPVIYSLKYKPFQSEARKLCCGERTMSCRDCQVGCTINYYLCCSRVASCDITSADPANTMETVA